MSDLTEQKISNGVKTRFAPSPTGFLHVGGLRTCLYSWLFAKKNNGKFILRVEDTDRQRYVENAVENLLKMLQTMGLDWDEGPFIENDKIIQKGDCGPYIQSERLEIYQNLAKKLVEEDKAYYCFCTSEELDKMKQDQMAQKLPPRYDERCRKLSKIEIENKLKNKTPYVIRLKVPEEGTIAFTDLIRGEIKFDLKDIDDQVLLKSDGFPTYHLAVVIDDYKMEITHIIRGEEWIPSVPKHILLYQYFNWPLPQFAHLPLLLNPDHSKLSKRQGDVTVEDYLSKGYLKEAILNFIAFLGWNPGTEQEIFTLEELIKTFSLEKIQKAGAVFNVEKLDWLNGCYIRQMNIDELTKQCMPYLEQAGLIKSLNFGWIKKIVALEQERLKRLNEIGDLTKFFFLDVLEYTPELLQWKKMDNQQIKDSLSQTCAILEKISSDEFTAKNIMDNLSLLKEKIGVGETLWPLRAALSGLKSSPPPEAIAEVLGKEKTINRVNQAIEKLK
ncbi:MAG: glutamate--tRNA ligase [Patescibacteria group bacterium]|jgi:glutamyl-tRNA synthetase